jgi:formylglycine-generating enzyme required for sulfatase activity|nr:SUMF1/EgtB/PvdO family nonheme iron enzyme [Candidatus Krumholzibacteria bacterium]
MAFQRRLIMIIAACSSLALLFPIGCAEQDLYEPPGAPFQRVGRVPLPSQNEGVAALGRHAFVAGGQAGLHSIDFTNPAHPVLLQTINTQKYSESVEVVRSFVGQTLQDIALVVEGTEGITSYDITVPDGMTSFETGTTAVFGNRVAVTESDDPEVPYVVFLAESWKGVRIFESIPAQPGILAYNGVFSGTNGYAEGVAVKDGYAYVADDQMGLAVLDARVLDLGSVQLVNWCDSPGEALDVDLSGDYAYVADGDYGLAVFRIDGGEAPIHVAQLELEGDCRAVEVRDGLAVLCAQGAGVHFVDVSNPRNPVFLGRIITEYAMDLTITREGFILVADRDEGLIIMEGNYPFTDDTPPLTVNSLQATPYALGSVELSWVMTGDDRLEGLASGLEIRMAETPITSPAEWDAATPLTDLPVPEMAGSTMSHVVTGLTGGNTYHFAMIVSDDAGLTTALSNSAVATAGEGILLLDPTLDIQGGTDQDLYTYEVTYIFSTAPDVHEVVIDGTGHPMSPVDSTRDGEVLYRFQTTLPHGQHDYFFRFGVDDPSVPDFITDQQVGPTVGALAFTMGSPDLDNELHPDYEPGRESDEWQHTVVLSDSLVAGLFEVTQADWADLSLANPSHFVGDDLPVETVTWMQAVQYCNLLSAEDGLTAVYQVNGPEVSWNREADGWRLPTEAEWEWLARGGSTTAFAAGPITAQVCNLDPVLVNLGWYCGSDYSPDMPGTRNVGLLNANDRGHFDLHGNVWEWCWDWYGDYRQLDTDGDGVVLDPVGPVTGNERVIRGGSWYSGSEACRSANRGFRFPDSADDLVGFRVVRTIFTDR